MNRCFLSMCLTTAALLGGTSCRSAGHLPVTLSFAPLVDAFGEPVELIDALRAEGDPPWRLMVGGADQLTGLLALRADGAAATIVDMSVAAPLQRDAVRAKVLDAALDRGGALLLDGDGTNVRALRGASQAITLVTLDARRVILAATPLAPPTPETRR